MRKDLFSFAKEKYDEKLDKELNKLDEEIEALQNIELGVSRRGFQTAIVFLSVIILISTAAFLNPKAVTAFKRTVKELLMQKTKEAVEFNIAESSFETCVPDGFNLAEIYSSKDIVCKRYEDETGIYLTIRLCSPNCEITLDSRDTASETIQLNGGTAFLTTKNGITTIIFYHKNQLIELESNLSAEECRAFAESLKIE